MSKLPNSLRLEVARKSTSEVWIINELLEIFKREIEARQPSDQVKLNESRCPTPTFERNQLLTPTAQTQFTKKTPGDSTRIRFVYCTGLHYSASCERHSGIQDRMIILPCDSRCFVFYESVTCHKSCQTQKGCQKCGQRTP